MTVFDLLVLSFRRFYVHQVHILSIFGCILNIMYFQSLPEVNNIQSSGYIFI